MRISPRPRQHIFIDREQRYRRMAELWESQSSSKKFQIILGQWEVSELSHAKKPCLYPALKSGLIPGYNWAIERR